MILSEVRVSGRSCPPSIHRQSIRPSTRFKRLPVWVSKADIVAYLKLSPTDAQAIFDSASRRCRINGQRFRPLIGRNISRKVAREIAVRLRSEIVAGNYGFGKKVKNITFDEARDQFERWAEANKKPQSVRSYKEALRQLADSFS